MDNIRSALEWSEHHAVAIGLQLASGLKWLWHLRNHWKEGADWLEKLLSAGTDPETNSPDEEADRFYKAKSLLVLSFLVGILGRVPTAIASIDEAQRLIENLDGTRFIPLLAEVY